MDDRLLIEYADHFGENFPIYAMPESLLSDQVKLKEFIEKCIAKDKPATEYYPYDDDLVY